ncbi:MAG TPA: pitrilysin family protein, partial [Candidatus Baltobacteraceae bacterium]
VYIAGNIASSPSFTPGGKEGIARLADAMADFGSEHYDFTRLRKVTDDIGASVSLGQTFAAHGFAQDLDTLLAVLADSEEHPAFPQRWLTLQQSQIANSIESENQISGVLLNRVYLQRLLSADDPALRYPTADSIQGITRDDLLQYTKQYWRPDLTTLAIVGDVTPQRARSAVEAAFGSWSSPGPTPSTVQMPLPAAHVAQAYIGTASTQVFIQLGQPAVARTSPDYDTFSLLTEILGGPGYFQSRLWQELRQKRGLVYSVQSILKASRDRGDLEIVLSASPQNVQPAIGIVRDQLEWLRTHPVSASELEDAKIRLVSQALLDEGSAGGQLDEIGEIANNGLPLDYYGTLASRYASITPADLQRAAKAYLRPDRLIEVFAGPEGAWSTHPL